MRCLVRHDGNARALLVIRAVVPHPRLSEHLMAETQLVIAAFVVERVLRKGRILRHLEAMRRGAHTDHRSAAIQIIIKVLHLLRRQSLKAQKHDSEICGVQRFHARDVLRLTRGDVAIRVDVEQHRTFEAVMLRKDARDGWQRFFRAIFMVSGQKDDVFAFARSVRAFIDKRCSAGERNEGE